MARTKTALRAPFALPSKYRLEIDSIDAEHSLLIDILNESLSGFDANGRAEFPDFEKYFRRLWQEMSTHFRHEEAEMKELQYPALLSHQHHHADVMSRLATVRDSAASRGYVDRATIEEIFENILADMLRADLGFKDFLSRKVLLQASTL
jgi:hemerythrin-like metal-binding protein